MVDNNLSLLENVHPSVPELPPEDLSNLFSFPLSSQDSLSDYFPSMADLSHLEKPPTLDEVESSHDFDVNLPGEASGKSSWIVSL